MDKIIVYTDGSCDISKEVGGWSYNTRSGIKGSGGCGDAYVTSQKMELLAAICALNRLKKEGPVLK